MQYSKIWLKEWKDFPVIQGHPWIFSWAIEKKESCLDGDIVQIFSKKNIFLWWAYYNSTTSISCRVFWYDSSIDPVKIWQQNITNAIKLRYDYIDTQKTNCMRLINAESDFLPGLIVDMYDTTLVVQISTLGAEKLKNTSLEILHSLLHPECIYENSDTNARKIDGLTPKIWVLFGKLTTPLVVMENTLKFGVNLEEGQKTGFFLDQREQRFLIRNLSKWKKVLNCFSFSWGFSLSARAWGAQMVTSVDISKKAMEECEKNYHLNSVDIQEDQLVVADVFKYIAEYPLDTYDIIILDPPAFAKKKWDIDAALKWYKNLNIQTLKKMKSWALLLTCSCSYYVDSTMFEDVIKKAGIEAKRKLKVLGRHILAQDHPISLSQRESEYIKSLLIAVY